MRSLELIVVGFLTLVFSGCAGDGYAEMGLVEVSGTVTLDGRPLAGAKVNFEGEDKRQALGVTDSAGKYELMYDSRTPGATPGSKTVRITTVDTDIEGDGVAEGVVARQEPVPARYNINSELNADVSPALRTFDFALKSAP
jgi:hypothetical protein